MLRKCVCVCVRERERERERKRKRWRDGEKEGNGGKYGDSYLFVDSHSFKFIVQLNSSFYQGRKDKTILFLNFFFEPNINVKKKSRVSDRKFKENFIPIQAKIKRFFFTK